MRMTIASMKQICENLTSQLTVCRTELRSLCDDRLHTDVSLSIHRLNAQLYDFLSIIKDIDISQHETERNDNTPSTSASEKNSSHDHSISTEVILLDLNPKRSKWSPLRGKFSALDHYIDKCCREIDQLNFKEKCNQYNLHVLS